MIPILYEKGSIEFPGSGLGLLNECISCYVTEEKNGIYELEFVYPMTGKFYEYMIECGGVVCAWHDDQHDIQPFDIYAHSDPMNGQVTFNAHHISYRLNRIITAPFTAHSPTDAMASFSLNAVNDCPFVFWTDKTGEGEMDVIVPSDIRSLLFGNEGSVLDVYGKGEYDFDMLNVKLYAERGIDTEVTIMYGKNLTDIKKEYDESDIFNAVAPFWAGESGIVTLPEIIVYPNNLPNKQYYLTDINGNHFLTRTRDGWVYTPTEIEVSPNFTTILPVPLDLTDKFDEEPTEEQLRTEALNYINRNQTWVPDENIKVDFVALWQTPEYENFAALQRCSLCDTVSVYYPELGVIAEKQKIIKVVYDTLLERYKSIELGKKPKSYSENLADEIIETGILSDVPTNSMMEAAIAHATQLITGGLGGYVVLKSNANGQTEEILIMDTPDISTAVHVIRMNRNGIGFSNNGYNGPYVSAWTIDGNFNADFITAGSINASLITTGSLVADIIKTGRVESDNGAVYFDLDNNELCCSRLVQNVTESSPSGYVTNKVVAEIKPENYHGGSGGSLKIYKLNASSPVNPFTISFDSSGYANLESGTGVRIYAGGTTASYIDVANNRIRLDSGSSTSVINMGSDVDVYVGANCSFHVGGNISATGSLHCSGTKSRLVNTEHYGNRLLYCYETAAPIFGDVGEGVLDEDGLCFIDLDDILDETVTSAIEYQVFLQKEASGDIWVKEKRRNYFVVEGTPGIKFSWELKAKQKNFEYNRMDNFDIGDIYINDSYTQLENLLEDEYTSFIQEMEDVFNEAAI